MYARTYIHCKNSSPIQSLVLMHLVIVYTVLCNKTQHVLQILGTFLDIRAHNYYNIPPSSSLLPTIIVCGSCSPTQLPKVINPQMYLGHHPQPYLAQYCISGSLWSLHCCTPVIAHNTNSSLSDYQTALDFSHEMCGWNAFLHTGPSPLLCPLSRHWHHLINLPDTPPTSLRTVSLFLFFLFFVTPEGFTTVVANEGLEKARAYLNKVPWDDGFTSPPKDAV